MSKITKNQRISTLERQLAALITLVKMKGYNAIDQRIEALEEFATYADNMLTELNHALPDPEYDAKCEAQEADINASLDRHRERLGLNKPQLKQLDQSIFNGLDEKWRFAAVDEDSRAFKFDCEPAINCDEWYEGHGQQKILIGEGYDASNWQNSLIERDDTAKELLEVNLSSELTGSDLARAMFERGDNYIMCVVGTIKEVVIIDTFQDGYFYSKGVRYLNPKPINNQGEPLTAAEAGL